MASEPVRSTTVVAAPKDYSIPHAQQIRLLSVTAEFSDNGAAGDWLPAVVILDNNGNALVRACDQGVTVTAGSDAEVSWFPGVKPAAAAPAPAGAGIVTANMFINSPGLTYPVTGGRIYLYDTTYGSPASDSTDTAVIDTNTTTLFNGNAVWAFVLNAVGTYRFEQSFDVRAADPGWTSGLIGLSTTGGVGPNQQPHGRYGVASGDTWENNALSQGRSELFNVYYMLVRTGQAPVYVTSDIILQGAAANVIATSSLYCVQLSPTPLASV